MCGRYAVVTSPEMLRKLFRYIEQPNFPARYNIAPTQPIAVVRMQEGQRHFALVRWGLIPSWVKDPKTMSLIINARGETVREKPAFRAPMRRRRCLIPADAYYEWQRAGTHKRPFLIRQRSREPMAFAGIWETWTGPNGEEMETAAIITTTANQTLRPIHDRMPVIVPPAAFEVWLDHAGEDTQAAAELLVPAADDAMEAYEISARVNRPGNDDPSLFDPVTPADAAQEDKPAPKRVPISKKVPKPRAKTKPDGNQGSLF